MKQILLLSLLFLKNFSASWDEVIYKEDMSEHRKTFLNWVNSGDFPEIYQRVKMTVGCTDSDYIPKHPDAGKVFIENGQSIQVMHNGIKILVDSYYGRWMNDLIYGLKGHHEPQEEKVFYEVLKELPSSATMIELGSYWGFYSLWFAKKIKNPTNYLIEPVPSCIESGKRNFALNNCSGNFIHGYCGSGVYGVPGFEGAPYIEIDRFMEEHNIDHIHILHSDIQGEEWNMIQTMQKALKEKKIDYLFISTHSRVLHAWIIGHLINHDYRIITQHTEDGSFSGDGLVVGCRKEILKPYKIPVSHRE